MTMKIANFMAISTAMVMIMTGLVESQAPVPAPAPELVPAPAPGPEGMLECRMSRNSSTVMGSTEGESVYPGLDAPTAVIKIAIQALESLTLSTCSEMTTFATALYLLPPGETDVNSAICQSEKDASFDCESGADQALFTDCTIWSFSDDYTILVTGASADQMGEFELSVSCGSIRQDIECGDTVTGTTTDAATPPQFDSPASIYFINMGDFNSLSASTCASETNFDAGLIVSPPFLDFDALNIACEGETCTDADLRGSEFESCPVEVNPVHGEGHVGFIIVSGADGTSGDFSLSVECLNIAPSDA